MWWTALTGGNHDDQTFRPAIRGHFVRRRDQHNRSGGTRPRLGGIQRPETIRRYTAIRFLYYKAIYCPVRWRGSTEISVQKRRQWTADRNCTGNGGHRI